MSEECFETEGVCVASSVPLCVRTLECVLKIGRIGDDEVECLLRLILQKVSMQHLQSFAPGRGICVFSCLCSGLCINLHGGDVCCGTALCQLKSNQSTSGAYVEYPFAMVCRCPGSQQYSVGAHFHGATVVKYGELFESEIVICHFLFNESMSDFQLSASKLHKGA